VEKTTDFKGATIVRLQRDGCRRPERGLCRCIHPRVARHRSERAHCFAWDEQVRARASVPAKATTPSLFL